MRIGPPGADENCLDPFVVRQVIGESLAHGGLCVSREREVICGRGRHDEVVNGREGKGRRDVDRGQERGKGRVGVEDGEQEDEQEETVFSAVVGEGEGRKTMDFEGEARISILNPRRKEGGGGEGEGVRTIESLRVFIESFLDDLQGYPCLRLCGFQILGLDVLIEERGDLGIEACAEDAQRVLASCQRLLFDGEDGSQEGGENGGSLGHFAGPRSL